MTVELVTVPNVHLLSVGTWLCSTGIFECFAEDIAAIVEAQDDPGVRSPIVKLGHLDTLHGLAAPAVGNIKNMRASDDGMDLYGDLVGIPKWLADILPSAYPSRSVEVTKTYSGSTGHVHQAVITALALLGVDIPAIESLEDIRELYAGELAILAGDGGPAAQRYVLTGKVPMPAKSIKASVSIDTVRSEFYEKLPSGSWAWIREIWSDFLIVDNDEGELYQIPWSEGTGGTVTFGTPVAVVVQYVPSTEEATEDAELIMLGRFVSKDPELRRGESHPPVGGHQMASKDLLDRLGLSEDASDEEIEAAQLAALDERDEFKATAEAKPTEPAPVSATPAIPEGVTVIDTDAFESLRVAAARGEEAHERIRKDDRDKFLTEAVAAGKFPPARKEHYAALYDKDPDGTRQFIEALTAGAIPISGESGHAYVPEVANDDAFFEQFMGSSPILADFTRGA